MPSDKAKNEVSASIARTTGVVPVNIVTEMRASFIDYAMSVIVDRALPDVRDGLKPVHRRILFAMQEAGLSAGARFKKSATIVGDVLGKYHPHGDSSVYEAMVKMAQPFSMRYPLVIGQGNFGCFTKDTKVRLADGRNLSFEELTAEDAKGKKNYAYTITNGGRIAISQIEKPRCTKRGVEIMKVVLDSGESVRCTLNHRFLLKNQTYVEARDLKPGTSLMPLYTRLSVSGDAPLSDMKGYEMVLQPLQKKWEFTHHLADAYNIEHDTYRVADGRVRHHVDFNKLNNSPENIRRMQWLDHWRLHSNLTAKRHANDPEYARKLKEGREAYWADNEHRKEYAKRVSARNAENWKDPIYRKQMKKFLSDVNKEYVRTHPEKREELSKRATRTLTRLWQDPEYQKFMREKIIKGNKNHTTNKTGKLKFDTVCAHVLSEGKKLSEGAYEEARLRVYPYGRATMWRTGVSKYYDGSVERILADVSGNHKVLRIEFLREYEDVYDLTVSETHNFALSAGVFVHNSVDGDSAAAYRYTEAKMSRVAGEVLADLEKNTVLFRPNYDGSRKEPVVMPSVVPNLLLNGTLGIAVGMATNIPPHNLREVVLALVHLIENPDASTEDLLQFVQGPDFPTGGLAYGKSDIRHAYAGGRGGVVCRGEAEIVEQKAGQTEIIITSIPYRVNKATLLAKIAELVREKKIEGIKDLRDESAKGDIRIAVYLKQGVPPQKVLNYLYRHTELETAYHYNMVALVDGVPQTLSLKSLLEEFINHRKVVVKRRTEFDLNKAKDREHILLGLKKALDHIDAIVKTIKASKDTVAAQENLMKQFKFSDRQATAILEMKLQRLAGLERKKVEDELHATQALIRELEGVLGSPRKMIDVIKQELIAVKEKYGDDRRTKIIKGGVKEISVEDTIPEKETILVFTAGGYIKRTDPSEYRVQRRGGVGVVDLDTKEEDFVTIFLSASTHEDILFFTDKGKAYQIKAYELPEGRRATKGKSIQNFLSLGGEERVTSMLALPREVKEVAKLSLLMVTEKGVVKKTAADAFKDVRRSGLLAIRLQPKDQLLAARFVEEKDDVSLVSAKGQSIRFSQNDVREMGRNAGGVRGMKLRADDKIVTADVVRKVYDKPMLIVISEQGYGKMTNMSEYKTQGRGGSGIKTANVTSKTGKVVAGMVLPDREGEIVAISKQSQVIRVPLKEIALSGRSTQGSRIMKLRPGDSIASLTAL